MSFGGFGKESGPTWGARAQGPSFGNFHRPRSPSPSPPLTRTRSQSPPKWDSGQEVLYRDYDAEIHQQSSTVMPYIAATNSRIGVPAKASQTQEFKRTRAPPSLASDEEALRNSSSVLGSHTDLRSKIHSHMVPQQKQSPPLAFQGNSLVNGNHSPSGESQMPASSYPMRGNQLKSVDNFINPLTQQVMPSVSVTNVVSHDFGRKSTTQHKEIQFSKRSRSPTFQSSTDGPSYDPDFDILDFQRPSAPPPKMRSSGLSAPSGSQSHQESLASGRHTKEGIPNKPMSFPAAKKTKLPSISSSDQVFQEDSISTADETNRELEAKAKRLVRFKDELNQPTQSDLGVKNQRVAGKRQHTFTMEGSTFIGESIVDKAGDFCDGHASSDYVVDSSGIIIGTCVDMCPDSERAERERKGDLDLYERLDGDRNQTSKSLAVKKYNRTAEREAELIRPMPILEKTMDYLLNLLNQPYDDSFLGLYNFLWDRMRAIRMDLRMQHIFSLGAIEMLEQMIRLHIIAMHELCEYTKGEGFSEGFDAHLNIEQMNKTSVELFQLYEDHRKKGMNVITEKEFRGYYALLKLDKHPGYKVEPAELSLDLAKMTPDMRQTPEVVFARDVARACRTGNFIAFFRLAQKASYLQACLMHAHFAKLRTQALASLHGGLQNNQGIPVAQVAKWLGMEEEDIEDLLEYYGFSVREFEEPFMVKEGPFLNVDSDYPVKCSKLVHRKKSSTIVEDVSYPCLVNSSSSEEEMDLQLNDEIKKKSAPVQSVQRENTIPTIDEEMPGYSSQEVDMLALPTHLKEVNQISVFEHPISLASPSVWDSSLFHGSPKPQLTRVGSMGKHKPVWDSTLFHGSPKSQLTRVGSMGKSKFDTVFRNPISRDVMVDLEETPPYVSSGRGEKESFFVSPFDQVRENSAPQDSYTKELQEKTEVSKEGEADDMAATYYDEVAEAKLKLILRIWKRRSSKKRELREQKQLAANVALTSLSLGAPVWCPEIQSSTSGDLNIDRVMNERYAIQEKSWSRLNISEVVAATLDAKNPNAKCLCWKILLCTEEESSYGDNLGKKKEAAHLGASSWLLSKLVPTSRDDDHNGDLAFSSQGLSIWRKLYPSQSAGGSACCLTVVREAKLESLNEIVAGASAVLFLVSECIPWELQRNRLHKILMAIPLGSCLPLLILSGSCKDNLDPSTITTELRLHYIDKSRMSSFYIAFLKDKQMEQFNVFFSDEQLRGGLQWLASESPPQPVLSWMKTRELVLSHLNSSLEVLIDVGSHEVGPNNCISAFNEAVNRSLEKIAAGVRANPSYWPCPEIAVLDEFSDEYRAVSCYLPALGWSSPERIEPLICALTDSRLPPFEDDISWLYRGANGLDCIEKQRLTLENCLVKYFTESSQMMVVPLARKEAYLMIQKFARLELHNSTYYILPQWVMIFQRVFHWRLMNLANGPFSSAYVLVHDDVSLLTSGVPNKIGGSIPLPSFLVYPTFDEMVEIGYNPSNQCVLRLDAGALQPYSDGHGGPKTIPEGNSEDDQGNVEGTGILVAKDAGIADQGNVESTDILVTKDASIANESNNGREFTLAAEVSKEADKLSKLLEKCNIMQNMIQEKLSIYF